LTVINKIVALGLAISLGGVPAFALVHETNHGDWPTNWPAEFEPLRPQARSIGLAAGNQEEWYEHKKT